MDANELRKLRKKLRQIEALEHLPRALTASETAKVCRKQELRKRVEELLTRSLEAEPEDDNTEKKEISREAASPLPDQQVNKSPPSNTTPKREVPSAAAPEKSKVPDPFPLHNSQFRIHSLEGHSDLVTCVIIYGSRVISGSWDTSVRIWDLRSGSELKTLCGHTGGVTCLGLISLSETELNSSLLPPGEEFISSGSSDSSIKVWSLSTGQPLLSIYTYSAVSAITHIPGTKLLVSGSDGGKIDVWDLETQQNLWSQRMHGEKVTALQYHSGYLYSGSSDGALKIWRASSSGSPHLMHSCDGLTQSLRGLYSLSITEEQVYIATQGTCLKAVSWKQDCLTRLCNHTSSSGFVDAVAVTHDNLLLTSGFNIDQGHGYLNIRDGKTGRYLGTLSDPDISRLLCVAVSLSPEGLCRWATGGRELLVWEELPKRRPLDRSAVQVQYRAEFLLPAPESDSEEEEEEDLWDTETEVVSSVVQKESPTWQWCALV